MRFASHSAMLGAGAAMLAVLSVGFAITRVRNPVTARILAWGLVASGFGAVLALAHGEPPLFRTLAICGVVLFAMKAVVADEESSRRGTRLNLVAWTAWAAAWPGMRPELFATIPWRPLPNAAALFGKGALRLAMGMVLVGLAHLAYAATGSAVAASIFALPGLSLILHFGIFNVLAGAWRVAGVDARSLFDAPLYATSLGEFWSRRWNLPFTEMTQRAVYGPLRPYLGRDGAALVAFGFSGLLHELAISVPVGAGYGLPTVYFVLHGVATRIELRLGEFFAERRVIAHIWTIAWLALPLPVLFHAAFLDGVVRPLIGLPMP